MKAAFAVLALALSGCMATPDPATTASERYQCTEVQMQKVASETLFCKRETEYRASYCYNTAIMRNCDPRSNLPGQQAAAPARKDGDA